MSRKQNSTLGVLVLWILLCPVALGQLRIMTPDFLYSEWIGPVNCFRTSQGVSVLIQPLPPDAILDTLLAGNNPGLAMVWDGWFEELDQAGRIVHLNLDDAYFPVIHQGDVLGVRIPWAEEWTAIIPTAASPLEQTLAMEFLQHACVWQRPIPEMEEYRAFAELLAARGHTLVWADRTEINREIGGVPTEIVVIPTDILDEKYYDLIVARDNKGKTVAQIIAKPWPLRTQPPTISSATLQTTHDTFMLSLDRLGHTLSDPPYCSKTGSCLGNLLDPECEDPLLNCIFNWIVGAVTPDQLALLDLQGNHPVVTIAHSNDYAWGARLRAKKLYEAMLNHDGAKWDKRAGKTAVRIRDEIIEIKEAFTWLSGFHLKGRLHYRIIPTGHRYWNNVGGGRTDLTRVQAVASSLGAFVDCDEAISYNGPFVGGMSSGCNKDSGNESDLDVMEDIPINWEMEYDAQTNILTIRFSAYGEAHYGVYEVCSVYAGGGGEAEAQAKLDGDEVTLELRLTAYIGGECGAHPCFHGDVAGGIGMRVEITYPDACTCRVQFFIEMGWGGHGEALGIKRDTCDVYSIPGPVADYNICDEDTVHAELKNQDDFTSRYGADVNSTIVQIALDDYALLGGGGGGRDRPWGESWRETTALHCGHFSKTLKAVTIIAPQRVDKGHSFLTGVDVSWVEDLGSGAVDLTFDPSLLAVTAVHNGKIGLVDVIVTDWHEVEPGRIRIEFVVPRTQGVTGSGYLAEVAFSANCPGQTQINFENNELISNIGEPLSMDWRRAVTTVRMPPDLDCDCHVGWTDLAGLVDYWLESGFGELTRRTIDDFESYADTAALQTAWPAATPNNVTLELETQTVSTGAQAMKYQYDLAPGPSYAMAFHRFDPNQDFSDFATLSLWLKADQENSSEIFFLRLQDVSENNLGQANYTAATELSDWTEWRIDLSTFSDLSAVKEITLGLAPLDRAQGIIYIDDLVLEPPCSGPIQGDINDDCSVDLRDLAAIAPYWLQ